MNVGGVPWTNQRTPKNIHGFRNVIVICGVIVILLLACFGAVPLYTYLTTGQCQGTKNKRQRAQKSIRYRGGGGGGQHHPPYLPLWSHWSKLYQYLQSECFSSFYVKNEKKNCVFMQNLCLQVPWLNELMVSKWFSEYQDCLNNSWLPSRGIITTTPRFDPSVVPNSVTYLIHTSIFRWYMDHLMSTTIYTSMMKVLDIHISSKTL